MKLAEALIMRADLQKRIERLKSRLTANAKVQEGDKPVEDPQELMKELDRVLKELTVIVQRINKTNCATSVDTGETLSDLLTRRDITKVKHSVYTAFADAASIKLDRYSKSEVKFRSTFDVAAIQKQSDALAKEYRDLDTKVQEANWLKDLIE